MSEPEPAGDEHPGGGPGPEAVRQSLVGLLKDHLGEALVESDTGGGDLWARVDRRAWGQAGQVCRDHLRMDYFCFLSGLDWKANPDLSGEKVWDPAGGVVLDSEDGAGEGGAGEGGAAEGGAAEGGGRTGVAGGDSRFQVLARVFSTTHKSGITLKADLDEDDPRVDSWVEIYPGADWHERETWEMFGFSFDGHPSLRHIYLPGEFEGHPLRKDFPLLAREVKPWPGLVDVEPMPGEEEQAPEDAATAEAGS